MTQMSVFPSTKPMSKTRLWPSGDHFQREPLELSRIRLDPSLSHNQIPCAPDRLESKTILFPSGEMAGRSSPRVEEMSRTGTPGLWSGPCRSTRQMFVSVLSTEYARRFPSREIAGHLHYPVQREASGAWLTTMLSPPETIASGRIARRRAGRKYDVPAILCPGNTNVARIFRWDSLRLALGLVALPKTEQPKVRLPKPGHPGERQDAAVRRKGRRSVPTPSAPAYRGGGLASLLFSPVSTENKYKDQEYRRWFSTPLPTSATGDDDPF